MLLHSSPRTRKAIITVALMFLAPWSGLVIELRAQTEPAKTTRVVIKAGANLRVGEQVVDTGKSHRIYVVEKTDGDWRWLVSGKIAGWARAVDVIPLNEAIEFYNAEIERNPHAAWAHYNRGLINQDHGLIDSALTDYTAALRQEPRFVPALINRGNMWMAKKTPIRAIEDYTAAIEVEPSSILAHVNRAIAWQSQKDFDKALADYDKAIDLGQKTAAAYNNRGHAREMKRDFDLAIADYDEAIQLDPGYHLAWMNRGSARQAKREYEQALADYAEATRLNPTSPWGYARQAWIRATCPDAKFRNGAEAVALATKASEMEGAREAVFVDIRASAHAEEGDFAKAVFWEKQAVALAGRARNADVKAEGLAYTERLKLFGDKKPFRDEK